MATIKLKGGEYIYSYADLLGAGAFGSVFKGQRISDGETIAIKIIDKKKLKAQGSYLIKALQREIKTQRIATESGLPFFVGIYDDFEDKKSIYLVLEYCQKSLNNFLASRKLKEEQCLELVFQVALGLNYLHSIQITHRDIKPDNILIKDGILKIADFGFATNSSQLTTNLGTAPYMSPEFFLDADVAFTQKIDVWALNTCLYRLLTGRFYFFSSSRAQMERYVLNKKFIISDELKDLSDATKDLLTQAYQKNPKNRLSMTEYVYHDAFKIFRKKYSSFLSVSFHGGIMEEAPKPKDEPNSEIPMRLLNFRNNTMDYYELSLLLYDNGFNKLISFLLLKRAIQNLSGLVVCYRNRTTPTYKPAEKLVSNEKEWNMLCDSITGKKAFCLMMEDLKVLLVKYSELYKGLLLLASKDKRFRYLAKQDNAEKLFDLNRRPEDKVLKKWFEQLVDNAGNFKEENTEKIVLLIRKVRLYEFHNPEEIFN